MVEFKIIKKIKGYVIKKGELSLNPITAEFDRTVCYFQTRKRAVLVLNMYLKHTQLVGYQIREKWTK
jgi:hypothetical protein